MNLRNYAVKHNYITNTLIFTIYVYFKCIIQYVCYHALMYTANYFSEFVAKFLI